MTFNEGIIWSMKLINWKKKEEKFLKGEKFVWAMVLI
jgi:hypothetical protein